MTTTSNFKLYFALKFYPFTSLFVPSVLTSPVFHVLCIPEPFFFFFNCLFLGRNATYDRMNILNYQSFSFRRGLFDLMCAPE
jgi:hypothetical protein